MSGSSAFGVLMYMKATSVAHSSLTSSNRSVDSAPSGRKISTSSTIWSWKFVPIFPSHKDTIASKMNVVFGCDKT